MGLFGLFSKKKPAKKQEPVKAVRGTGERLDRLSKDGGLPFGWYTQNKAFTEKIEKEHHILVNAYVESKKKSPKEYHAALKSLTKHTADVRKLCASKGECFVYWSSALFGDEDYKALKDELKHVEKHMDELNAKYKTEQQIHEELPKIIKKNPGILQTDVYKMFPVESKGIVSSALYTMECTGEIIRKKSGRTYSLTIGKTKKKARA